MFVITLSQIKKCFIKRSLLLVNHPLVLENRLALQVWITWKSKSLLMFTWLTLKAEEGRVSLAGLHAVVRALVFHRDRGPSLWAQLQPLHLVLFKVPSADSYDWRSQPPYSSSSSNPSWGEGTFLVDGLFSEGNYFFLWFYCPALSWP